MHDPAEERPFGLVEVKCPFSHKNRTPLQAGESRDLFCSVELNWPSLKLKCSHPYFCQVQGQMAITERCWCDFVVYTEKGLSVEGIQFDEDFWKKELLPKLTAFYDNCLAPEIVCPVHVLGIPVRNLKDI